MSTESGADVPPPSGRVAQRFLLGLAAVIFLIGIDWGLPAYATWSNDDQTPIGPLKAVHNRFLEFDKYPPAQYAILAAAYAPAIGWWTWTGDLRQPKEDFPYGFTDPLSSLTTLMVIARLVSVLMALGIVWLIGRATLRLTGDGRAQTFAMAVAVGNAYLVLFAHLGNFDVPALFWSALAFLLLLRFEDEWRPRRAVALGAAAALAISTKEQVYSILAGYAIWLLIVWVRDRRSGLPIAAGLLSAFVTYAFVNNWVFAFDVWRARFEYWTNGPGTKPYVEVAATLEGHLSLLVRFGGYVVSGASLPIVLAALAGLWLMMRSRTRALALILPALTYYLGSIASIRFAYPRFALPLILFLAPAAGLSLAWLWKRGTVARVASVMVTVFALAWGARIDASLLLDSRYDAEAFLAEHLPPPARVEVYSMDTYLPRLAERGYAVTQLDPRWNPEAHYTIEALNERASDAVILTTNFFPRFDEPPLSEYFYRLQQCPEGYELHRFEGGPAWLGWRSELSEFSRVSPTIFVLLRKPRR
ncbi:MAG: hypothetical protein RL885_23530 [Planctomycetota bacterium]